MGKIPWALFMKSPKKIRGILDLLQIDENDNWEIDQTSIYLPEALLHASPEDLSRWVIKVYCSEALENFEKAIR